ncbi:MAG: cation transporter [Phycisphaerales bacterium]|nr:cation transporter [Phycisphaerales bacterium]
MELGHDVPDANSKIRDPRTLAMRVSLFASVLMLGGKLTAYFLTHSAAMFADAAESVVHGVATGFATFSLWYASRPADAGHPYGHGRIVYLSTGFEGALVLAASIAVFAGGIDNFLHRPKLTHMEVGLIIAGALAAFNLVLGLSLVSIGKKYNALVLVANGKHVLSDFWTTAAAIIGLGLVRMTGVYWLDPVAALLIGAYIMYTGITLLQQAYSGLMDKVDPEVYEKIEAAVIDAVKSEVISDYHELRCRQLNDEIIVESHMLVPGKMPLHDAHRRVTSVEQRVRELFPKRRMHIVTHIEPREHDTAHPADHPHQQDGKVNGE